MADDSGLGAKHALLNRYLNERQRRLVAAADARFLGPGGIAKVARATGLSRTTLHKAVRELEGNEVPPERVRKAGGGRKSKAGQNPELVKALEQFVDPATRGDPMSPLRWSSKSTAKLAEELCRQGYKISARTVADMLKQQNYSLQANRKTREGSSNPDRDAQFLHINEQTKAFQQRGAPVVSVDAKKKELVGDYKNGGREWQPKGSPEKVQVHDFPDEKKGKHAIAPFGPQTVQSLGENLLIIQRASPHVRAQRSLKFQLRPRVLIMRDRSLRNSFNVPRQCRSLRWRKLPEEIGAPQKSTPACI